MASPRGGRGAAPYAAVLLDLDGVLTETAHLHAAAWKQAFDAALLAFTALDGQSRDPFDATREYRAYVDGKPREAGVRSFFAARQVPVVDGAPSDPPEALTVYGVSNHKNALFEQRLHGGVTVYDEVKATLHRWRADGLRLGVISASRHCTLVLRAGGLDDFFDARVDGNDRASLGLRGKPAPDTFLEGARRLAVAPKEAVVIEDALAGIEAGRAGRFGLIVGVARGAPLIPYFEHGADVVVSRLDELDLWTPRAAFEGPAARP